MTKIQFILSLSEALSGMPKDEIEERLSFYNEMIDDRIEDGLTEEEAVAEIGPIEEIVNQTVEEVSLTKLVKEKVRPKRKLHTWEIVLLAVGSPLWLSLGIVAVAMIFTFYAVLWSVGVVTIWAVFVASAVSCVGGGVSGTCHAFTASAYSGLALVGGGLILGGLSIFLFYASLWSTKAAAWLTKTVVVKTKRCLMKKEDAE